MTTEEFVRRASEITEARDIGAWIDRLTWGCPGTSAGFSSSRLSRVA